MTRLLRRLASLLTRRGTAQANPPVVVLPDEASQIRPVPLPAWIAERPIRWSPIPGSVDPAVALRRAQHLTSHVDLARAGDIEFFRSKADQILAAMFCAADLGGADLGDIQSWIEGHNVGDAVAHLTAGGYPQLAAILTTYDTPFGRVMTVTRDILRRAVVVMLGEPDDGDDQ